MDRELEDGTNIYIKHVRKMAKLTDEQMRLLMTFHTTENGETLESLNRINPNISEAIESQIRHIRQMQNLTDDQIKAVLIKNNMQEILKEGALKRNLKDITNAAKDIRGDPRAFARKIDRF